MNRAGQVKIVGGKLHLSSGLSAGQVEFFGLFLTLKSKVVISVFPLSIK